MKGREVRYWYVGISARALATPPCRLGHGEACVRLGLLIAVERRQIPNGGHRARTMARRLGMGRGGEDGTFWARSQDLRGRPGPPTVPRHLPSTPPRAAPVAVTGHGTQGAASRGGGGGDKCRSSQLKLSLRKLRETSAFSSSSESESDETLWALPLALWTASHDNGTRSSEASSSVSLNYQKTTVKKQPCTSLNRNR